MLATAFTFAGVSTAIRGWSGDAMVPGKHPMPGSPKIWMMVGQGPTPLVVGAGRVVWTFSLLYFFSSIFSLFLVDGPIYTEILSQRAFNQKQPGNLHSDKSPKRKSIPTLMGKHCRTLQLFLIQSHILHHTVNFI